MRKIYSKPRKINNKKYKTSEFFRKKIDRLYWKYSHSKYATYLENVDYVDLEHKIYGSKLYARSMVKSNMFPMEQAISPHTSYRGPHGPITASIALKIAKGLRLNEDFVRLTAMIHDIGQPPLSHEGETGLNNLAQRDHVGCVRHSALGVKSLIYVDKIPIPWEIAYAILSHDGENPKNGNAFNPNLKEEDFNNDLVRCLTEEGAYKEIEFDTLEAKVVAQADKIATAFRDLADALREGVIEQYDDNILRLFLACNLSKEDLDNFERAQKAEEIDDIVFNSTEDKKSCSIDELKEFLQNYTKENLCYIMESLVVNNIINTSYDKPDVIMSKRVGKAMEDIKTFIYTKIIPHSRDSKDMEFIMDKQDELYNSYAEALVNSGVIKKKAIFPEIQETPTTSQTDEFYKIIKFAEKRDYSYYDINRRIEEITRPSDYDGTIEDRLSKLTSLDYISGFTDPSLLNALRKHDKISEEQYTYYTTPKSRKPSEEDVEIKKGSGIYETSVNVLLLKINQLIDECSSMITTMDGYLKDLENKKGKGAYIISEMITRVLQRAKSVQNHLNRKLDEFNAVDDYNKKDEITEEIKRASNELKGLYQEIKQRMEILNKSSVRKGTKGIKNATLDR